MADWNPRANELFLKAVERPAAPRTSKQAEDNGKVIE